MQVPRIEFHSHMDKNIVRWNPDRRLGHSFARLTTFLDRRMGASMFWLAQQYSRLYGEVKDRTGRDLRGLGFLLRQLKIDRTLRVQDRTIWMNHEVAQCYGRLIVGDWNEPETHTFLNYIFDRLDQAGTFVDVGANVGEMVLDLAGHSNVSRSYAFEPIPACAESIRRSLELNGFANATVIESLCGDEVGWVQYAVSDDVSNSSLHSTPNETKSSLTAITTLDETVHDVIGEIVILADVEGHELNVIRGGQRLIETYRPMIIFEYNYVSKAHFSISEMQIVLGGSYTIWRLRQDAHLDRKVDAAWNCVAIPLGSVFEQLVAGLQEV